MRIGVGPLVLLSCLTTTALGQAPVINSTVPLSVQPGATTEVSVSGTNLSPATAVWTDTPGKCEVADQGSAPNGPIKLKWEVPAGTPLQVAALRVATEKGGSNVHLLLVDDLPTVRGTGKNLSPSDAQAVEIPTAIDGATAAKARQYYSFEAKQGQQVSCEVWARRLGSPLDPAIRLLDDSGRELAFSDDEPGLPADGRFRVTIPHDGKYLVEIRDISYSGNALYRYHLRIGDFPLVSTTFPLAAERGKPAEFAMAGPGITDSPKVSAPAAKSGEVQYVGKPSKQGGVVAVALLSGQTEFVEQEPNDKPGDASGKNEIKIPCGVNGRFQEPRDKDAYTFAAKKGEKFSFSGQARSLGSPADLLLSVTDEQGKQLAQAEDTGTEEGSVAFTAPADGNFVLLVEDLLRRGGPEFTYRVDAQVGTPTFSLAAEVDKYDVPQGGVMLVKLKVARSGYNGPIKFHLEGAPKGTEVAGQVGDKKADGVAKITLPEDVKPGTLLQIRLVGSADVAEGQTYSAEATTIDALRTALKGLTYPPRTLNGPLSVAVTPPFPNFFELACETQELTVPRLAGTVPLKITTKRLNKFADAVALAVVKSPEGLTLKPAPIDKGKNDVTLALAATDKLAPGKYELQLKGSATFSDQPQTVELPKVAIHVVDALELSAKLAKPLTPGGKQILELKVVRNAELPGAIEIAFAKVPEGLKVPEKVSIPADKDTVEVPVELAADAKLANDASLQVDASTKFEKQTIAAQAEVALAAKKPGEKPAKKPAEKSDEKTEKQDK